MMGDFQSHRKDFLLYKKTARVYDRERFSGRSGEWGNYRQISIMENLVQDWQGKKILEIGCGTGRVTECLVRWGAEVTAIDISEQMLKVARERFGNNQKLRMPEFRVMSVFDLDIDLQNYDYVIMVNVLGHLSNPQEAIHIIASKMSKKCRFVFTFPCLTSILLPFGVLVNARKKSLFRDVTSRWYTPGTVARYCNEVGLSIVRWFGTHYVPYPRFLFPMLPFFQAMDSFLAKPFPKRCPSVFLECKRK